MHKIALKVATGRGNELTIYKIYKTRRSQNPAPRNLTPMTNLASSQGKI